MKNFGGYFDPQKKLERTKELEDIMNNSNFWNDKRESEKVISELNELKRIINRTEVLKDKIASNYSMVVLGQMAHWKNSQCLWLAISWNNSRLMGALFWSL